MVNLSNSATLTWGGSGSFLPDQAPLMLGTWWADSMVDFQNPIRILAGSGPQNVQVTAGCGTAAVNGRLSGVLSGSGGLISPRRGRPGDDCQQQLRRSHNRVLLHPAAEQFRGLAGRDRGRPPRAAI